MSARAFLGDWDLVARIIDAGGTIKPPVLPAEPQVFTFGGASDGGPVIHAPLAHVVPPVGPPNVATYTPPADPAAAGTLTISTPAPEGARLWHLAYPYPITTFAPAPRATLEALRDAIDRALAAPSEVQICDGVFGGHGYRLALSWTGEP